MYKRNEDICELCNVHAWECMYTSQIYTIVYPCRDECKSMNKHMHSRFQLCVGCLTEKLIIFFIFCVNWIYECISPSLLNFWSMKYSFSPCVKVPLPLSGEDFKNSLIIMFFSRRNKWIPISILFGLMFPQVAFLYSCSQIKIYRANIYKKPNRYMCSTISLHWRLHQIITTLSLPLFRKFLSPRESVIICKDPDPSINRKKLWFLQ
jgi:hypothetical protein